MGDVVELKQEQGSIIPITQADLEQLQKRRKLLSEFIQSQMREAQFKDDQKSDYGEGDYGVIPGTKKKALLKPGAEKLLQLFGLGVRVKLVDKDIDRFANFAIYNYSAEVYHLKTGVIVAQCEASANSQEVKYKERTVWRKNEKGVRVSVKEETPITDILNTLMKMAQKRAISGATITATAASDYFYPDLETAADAEAIGIKARVEGDRPATKDVASTAESAPACEKCNRPMMISKYPNRDTGAFDWYCAKDRITKAR